MRTTGKVIEAAQIDKNWKQELYKFLRNYRAAPRSTTGVPSAQALFGKNFRTKLPGYSTKVKNEVDIHMSDEENKCKMKEYSDNKNNAKYSGFNEGDCLLVKTPKTNTFSTPFKSFPYYITNCSQHRRSHITRNSSHFKKIKKELMEDTLNKDNDLDDEQLELDNEEFQNNT